MGAAFRELVADGTVGGLWWQACTVARGDEEVAARCRSILTGVLHETGELTASTPAELASFLGRGLLVLQLQTLGVDLGRGSAAAVESLLGTESR
ncbi:hypothetical protein [Agromyces archimandritae]|uniref:Uncharacterized protein n=1 Tax=Agromyces archimandritae TaxID=2781962 RepID=A0A975FPE1_9MICO|nr:hypothetical protein [Agromyces archimandritae]QTX05579.1 hypothetical protein G127AT_05035 [Agromyces archimandritae]